MGTSSDKLREFLRIEHTIFCGPMGGVSCPELVAAVSNAGGLGFLPIWSSSPEDATEQVRATRALTDRPFAVNLRADLNTTEHVEAAVSAGTTLVHVFWGSPAPCSATALASGATLIATVDSAGAAQIALDAGARVLIAQGIEAGGHVLSETPLRVLLGDVLELAGDTPVVAAGGITSSEDVKTLAEAGAAGVLCGTRFVASEESLAHPDYKAALLAAGADATVRTRIFDIGWPDAPLRTLLNSTYRMWEEAGRPSPGTRPGEGEIIMRIGEDFEIPRYSMLPPMRGMSGKIEAAVMYAGVGVSRVDEIKPAAEIVLDLASGYSSS
ncbi:MAG: nitronate monooxygenase [Pseudomonadota bacterium]